MQKQSVLEWQQRWVESSPLLRWGSVLVLVLVLMYPLVFLWDERLQQREQVAEWQQKVIKVQSVNPEDSLVWQQQAEVLNKQTDDLHKRFWLASEVGLVEVDIRQWLETLLVQSYLEAQLVLEASEFKQMQNARSHWVVAAVMSGRAQPEQVLPLLRAIEESEHFAELVQVVLSPRSFELTLHILVLKEA